MNNRTFGFNPNICLSLLLQAARFAGVTIIEKFLIPLIISQAVRHSLSVNVRVVDSDSPIIFLQRTPLAGITTHRTIFPIPIPIED